MQQIFCYISINGFGGGTDGRFLRNKSSDERKDRHHYINHSLASGYNNVKRRNIYPVNLNAKQFKKNKKSYKILY